MLIGRCDPEAQNVLRAEAGGEGGDDAERAGDVHHHEGRHGIKVAGDDGVGRGDDVVLRDRRLEGSQAQDLQALGRRGVNSCGDECGAVVRRGRVDADDALHGVSPKRSWVSRSGQIGRDGGSASGIGAGQMTSPNMVATGVGGVCRVAQSA